MAHDSMIAAAVVSPTVPRPVNFSRHTAQKTMTLSKLAATLGLPEYAIRTAILNNPTMMSALRAQLLTQAGKQLTINTRFSAPSYALSMRPLSPSAANRAQALDLVIAARPASPTNRSLFSRSDTPASLQNPDSCGLRIVTGMGAHDHNQVLKSPSASTDVFSQSLSLVDAVEVRTHDLCAQAELYDTKSLANSYLLISLPHFVDPVPAGVSVPPVVALWSEAATRESTLIDCRA